MKAANTKETQKITEYVSQTYTKKKSAVSVELWPFLGTTVGEHAMVQTIRAVGKWTTERADGKNCMDKKEVRLREQSGVFATIGKPKALRK